mmetsp:Transcript_2228/g.6725  ORF Transcript_2228/g.6725 Transcript_2228/m.6725 type:complete len:264 (-) Transcript_2228:185-976(-)
MRLHKEGRHPRQHDIPRVVRAHVGHNDGPDARPAEQAPGQGRLLATSSLHGGYVGRAPAALEPERLARLAAARVELGCRGAQAGEGEGDQRRCGAPGGEHVRHAPLEEPRRDDVCEHGAELLARGHDGDEEGAFVRWHPEVHKRVLRGHQEALTDAHAHTTEVKGHEARERQDRRQHVEGRPRRRGQQQRCLAAATLREGTAQDLRGEVAHEERGKYVAFPAVRNAREIVLGEDDADVRAVRVADEDRGKHEEDDGVPPAAST